MKLILILSTVCVITLAMYPRENYGVKAHSQFSTVHPAIEGRFSPSNPAVPPLRRNVLAAPSSATLAAGDPEGPRVFLNTDYVAPTGQTIAVNAGGDLQSALDQAQPGDVVLLQAGATFKGNFVLRDKNGAGWITIRTSTSDQNLPPGTRVTPNSA